jgi:aspartate/methionine/tyrosine aminotransferase
MFLLQFSLNADTLIQSPSWVSYNNQSIVLDAPCTPVPTTFENKWKFVPESFKDKVVDDKNQLVIINYPGNPTG